MDCSDRMYNSHEIMLYYSAGIMVFVYCGWLQWSMASLTWYLIICEQDFSISLKLSTK